MIDSRKNIARLVSKRKKLGKTVGLITGCFDVLHYGHATLFKYAKTQVDYLIVALENDQTIEISKGKPRPINSAHFRLEMVDALQNVNAVFENRETYDFSDSDKAETIMSELLHEVSPDYLITSITNDLYWKKKEARTEKLGVKFLPIRMRKADSSTEIIETLPKEYFSSRDS